MRGRLTGHLRLLPAARAATYLTWRRGSMPSAAHSASPASPSSPSSVSQRQPAGGVRWVRFGHFGGRGSHGACPVTQRMHSMTRPCAAPLCLTRGIKRHQRGALRQHPAQQRRLLPAGRPPAARQAEALQAIRRLGGVGGPRGQLRQGRCQRRTDRHQRPRDVQSQQAPVGFQDGRQHIQLLRPLGVAASGARGRRLRAPATPPRGGRHGTTAGALRDAAAGGGRRMGEWAWQRSASAQGRGDSPPGSSRAP